MNSPPLPAKQVVDRHIPTGIAIYGWTEKQMREYANAAVLKERENNIALKKILAIVCAYLPPDGISVELAMAEIIAIVDPGTDAKEIPA